MKRLLLVLAFALVAGNAAAEIHTIGVDISRRPDQKVRVSLTSVVPEEAKKDISIEEAAKILRAVMGSGSAVYVGIIVHNFVGTFEYFPLLRAIAENGAEIVFVDSDAADYVKENMRNGMLKAK